MGGYVKTITYDDSLYCLVPREQHEAIKLALKDMLHIFDRGLEGRMIGRMVCDAAIDSLAKITMTVQPAQEPDAMRAAGQCCCDDSE